MHQGGGEGEGGLTKASTPYKKYHFPYTKCVLGGGGANVNASKYLMTLDFQTPVKRLGKEAGGGGGGEKQNKKSLHQIIVLK